MTSTDLHTEIRDDIAIVRLTRGKKRNALSATSGLGADDRAGVWAVLHLRNILSPTPSVLLCPSQSYLCIF